MPFIKKNYDEDERVYAYVTHYQQDSKKLVHEYYDAVRKGTPVKVDMLTARNIANKVNKTSKTEKIETIIACTVCVLVVLVWLCIFVMKMYNGFSTILLVSAILAVVYSIAFCGFFIGYKKRTIEYDAMSYAVKHGNYSVTSLTVTEKHYYKGNEDENYEYYIYCDNLVLNVSEHTYKTLSVGSKITAAIVNADGIDYFFTIGYNRFI